MTSRVGKVRITVKDGRTVIERKRGYTTKNRALKASRLEKKWRAASKPKGTT